MIAAAILLYFLPFQVNGLITTNAKCLTGYEWMFSSIGQSPCDVAAELAGVCVGGQFNVDPPDTGYIYAGPTQANQNSCRCSSVYYSLLSACGYCQGRNYLRWPQYHANCSTIYVTVYNQHIPVGVKVPVYAYQNVSISDTFDVTLAHSMDGIESSRPPSSSTFIATSVMATSTTGSNGGTSMNIPAIVVGAVVAVVGLGGLVLILCLRLCRRKRESQADDHSSQFNANTGLMTSITPMMPGRSGSPGSFEKPNDMGKYSPSMNSPYREHSPPFRFQTLTPDDTGHSSVPTHTGSP